MNKIAKQIVLIAQELQQLQNETKQVNANVRTAGWFSNLFAKGMTEESKKTIEGIVANLTTNNCVAPMICILKQDLKTIEKVMQPLKKTKETNKTGEMLEFIFRSYKDRHIKVGIATHDPCAVVCYSHPEYFTWDDMYVHIHFLESANTGVIDFDENSEKPNMQVVTDVNIKKFKQHYFKTLKKMP